MIGEMMGSIKVDWSPPTLSYGKLPAQNAKCQYIIRHLFARKWIDKHADRPDLMADWRVSRTRCSVSSDACKNSIQSCLLKNNDR